MEQHDYYGINAECIKPEYFKPQKDAMGFEIGSNPRWDRMTNGIPVTVTALTSVEGNPVKHFSETYSKLVNNYLIGDLEKAIVQIDQPKK